MLHRFDVSRCCCDVTPPDLHQPQLSGIIWAEEEVDNDPLVYSNIDAFSEPLTSTLYLFPSGDDQNIGALLVIPDVLAATYTNFQVRFSGFKDGVAEEFQEYELYILNDPARGVLTGTPADIALADLLGPVNWDDSATSWGTVADNTRRTTPNLATHVNTVVNDAAWVDNTSCLWLLFKVVVPTYPQASPYSKGRWIFFDVLDSDTWAELITS